MKRKRLQIATLGGAFALVGIIAYFQMSGPTDSSEGVALIPPPGAAPLGELKATADEETVFKRAFWRRPTAKDHIKHAELSEWLEDGAEVSRWQWFIEVEPSADLKGWLQERNPFSLVAREVVQLPAGAAVAPDWFPKAAGGFEIRQSADDRMSLLFSREGNVLFATASGYGFARGAEEPAAGPVAKMETTGRLPLTPPPNPPRP